MLTNLYVILVRCCPCVAMTDTLKQEDGQQPEESQLVSSSPREIRETSSTCLPDLTPASPVAAEKGDKIAESDSSCLTHHLSPPVEEEKATEKLSETIAGKLTYKVFSWREW